MITKIIKKVIYAAFNLSLVAFGVNALFGVMFNNFDIRTLMNENVFGSGYTEIITSNKPGIYYKTWYQSVDDVLSGSGAFAAAAEAEGAVLLKNDNNALPLKVGQDKVSLFGVTAYNPIYSLKGAGKIGLNTSRNLYFDKEFKRVGLDVNEDLATWYRNNSSYYRKDPTSNGNNATVNGAPWSAIDTSKSKAGYKTAVYVVGRNTNEAIDIPPITTNGNGGLTDNDYLKLTSTEISVLQGMKAQKDAGNIDKIIVLFNCANPFQENIVNNAAYGIDAAMWVGFPGSDGMKAIADLMVGKSTPSGKLPQTWYSSRKANPNWNYFGTSGTVIYQEGVYLGYKYAETRYEDYVLENPNAGTYDYNANVNFSFGYGLSYTNFKQEFLSVENDSNPEKNYNNKGELKPADQRRKAGDDLIAKVKVTNTGSVAGKEVVQVYVQQPVTEANKTRQVEKPSVELVGFAKTKKLAPNESQTVEVKIDANKTFAAFDRDEDGYILDAGTYLLAIGNGAHEATNNILANKGKNSSSRITAQGDASKVKSYTVDSNRSASYKYWTNGGNEVKSLFDMADPNRADPNGDKTKFMSRYNWTGTVSDTKQANPSLTGNRNKGKSLDSNGDFANAKTNFPYYEDVYPTYGKVLDQHLNLIDMRGVEYDPRMGATEADIQKWNDFLDQLTWDETVKLVSNGRRSTAAIESIAKPYTNDLNASNGISWRFDPKKDSSEANNKAGFAAVFDKNNRNLYPTGYPCESIIAATFNIEIAETVGKSVGEDALWAGTSGLYGFGLNLLRNPYHGRAGEYYSEDSYLSGMIGGYESKGAQSKGLYVYNKHFVLNDQETSRSSYTTWITEQALRQTHLRAFEIAIEIGDAMNVMTAFSRIGTYWSGNCYNLMTACLRGEFGMRGFAVTDWYKSSGMGMANGLLAGQDLPDGSSGSEISGYGPSEGKHGFLAQAARVSAQRILYTVANSNAMNFFGNNTTVIVHDPEWYQVKDQVNDIVVTTFIVTSAATVGITAFVVVMKVLDELKKRKQAK